MVKRIPGLDRILAGLSQTETGCVLFDRYVSDQGYGVYSSSNFSGVHRYVLSHKLGREIRPGLSALHTCDVRNCVAEEHLYEGTQSKNMQDAYTRGKRPTILNPEKVLAIRRLYARGTPRAVLSTVFGVSRDTISSVVSRRSWSWIKES